ncbi:hypothetical protein B0H17DRAFT_1193281 [Mycena rosella]|uniref:Uncharacterized protein n=1 Tax=Mycena rosella TaxID=1033263 RepID=A0AAD7M7L0_MYCRO|nr:hypothetical protein B0H17DRAFT_1193281 [Mycena rosella]
MGTNAVPIDSPTQTIQEEKPALDLEKGAEDTPQDPPEGGLDAWLSILGASLVALATFGYVSLSKSARDCAYPGYDVAGLSGALFDAYGPRYMIPASGVIIGEGS